MAEINDYIRSRFFKRSYEAIDGLWFMKTEDDSDFEHALEIDKKVWEVVPKIQARTLRALLEIGGDGLPALAEALGAKAELDEADVELEIAGGSCLRVTVRECPWFRLMQKSKREHLAARVGEVICGTEYPAWGREFGVNGLFEIKSQICDGSEYCIFEYHTE